jgi:Cu-processing system permease protein
MQVYNSREFTELLLSQPVQRTTVFIASFLGVMLPPALCFSLGAGIPLVAHSLGNTELLKNAALLLVTGALLSCSFSAIAFAITTKIEERARGFGASLMVWFFSSVMYDGILLFFLYALSDYPTERFALIMSFCNPIDLARITLSLLLDQSALMGYTGALYKNFFGSGEGLALSLGVLGMWTIAPVFIARRVFLHKDFS